MRVIAGKWKGRHLASFHAEHIRPTTDRVKESLFNILQDRWDQALVLDLFSGTGSLGFEALSRGARHVTFVEMSVKSVSILRKNQDLLQVDESDLRVVRQDARKYLRSYQGSPFDVVLMDPPFTEALSHELMGLIANSQVLGVDTIVVVETAKKEKILDNYPPLVRYDQRAFGDKFLNFFRRGSGTPNTGSSQSETQDDTSS